MKNKLTLQNIIKHIKTMFYNLVSGQFKKSQIDTISWWLKKRYNLMPMRELSETEKQVIIRLVEWEKILQIERHNYFQLNLSILFGDLCKKYNSSFNIDFTNNEIELKSTSEKVLTGLGENNCFRRDFISLVHFIDYLKLERLIYIVPNDPDINGISTERDCLIPNKTPFVSRINDLEFIELLKNFYSRDIYPTEYLTKYYKNDCRTDEEVRFKDTMYIANEGVKKAKQSLRVAIGLGVVSILLTLFTTFKPNSDTQLILTKIDNVKVSNDTKLILTEISKLSRKVEIGDSLLGLRIDKIDNRLTNLEKRVDKLEIKPNR